MTRKTKAVDQLSEYFATIEEVPTRNEYMLRNDGPLSFPAIRRSCGSWVRMIAICDRTYPDRMAIARGSEAKAAPPAPEMPPKPVDVPKKTEAQVTTASEALQKLKEANE